MNLRALMFHPVRFTGVKKKPNYEDQPKRYSPKVPRKQNFGFQKEDGEQVYAGDVLVMQRGLEYYPGENVKLRRDNWDLVALVDGKFIVSTDELTPYPYSPLFDSWQDGKTFIKTFVHVVAEPYEGNFRLVEEV